MKMGKLTAQKYRELFKLRAEGKLDDMECTKSLYKILKPLYFDGIKILDIPCGVGHYFRKLKELGSIDYLGLDLDSEAIEMAKKIWEDEKNAKFDVQDICNLDLKDNSIDVVYCYNLLLHLPDYKEATRELFRVSKKYIIIRSLFDEKNNIQTINVAKDYLKVYPSGKVHYNTYSRESVEEFFKSLGSCKIKLIKDNILIPKKNLEEQKKILKVDISEFADKGGDKKQEYKGLELNYEVLFLEKK